MAILKIETTAKEGEIDLLQVQVGPDGHRRVLVVEVKSKLTVETAREALKQLERAAGLLLMAHEICANDCRRLNGAKSIDAFLASRPRAAAMTLKLVIAAVKADHDAVALVKNNAKLTVDGVAHSVELRLLL
jgi:Holliday junction resolvase-like predicted endonuclease